MRLGRFGGRVSSDEDYKQAEGEFSRPRTPSAKARAPVWRANRRSRGGEILTEPETPKPKATRRRATRRKTTTPAATEPAATEATPTEPVATQAAPEPTVTEPAATEAEPPARRPVRGIASWILTVLAAIAVSAAVIGFWVHQTVLETDQFMAAVTPVVESESVQAVVSDRLADEALEALDLEARVADRISGAATGLTDAIADALGLSASQAERLQRLDAGLQGLAAPITAGIESRVREAVHNFVASASGSDLLVDVIRVAHERAVLLLRDELDELPRVVIEEGEVRLNLVPVLAEAIRSVVNAGVGAVGIEREIPPFESSEDAEQAIERLAAVVGHELRPDFGQVPVMSEEQLRDAQGLVQTFDRLVWVILIVAVVLAVLAVVLAPTLASGLIRVGIAVAIAVVVGWIGVTLISSSLPDVAATAAGETAIADLVSAIVRTLQPMAAALAIIGIGTAAGAFILDRGVVTVRE